MNLCSDFLERMTSARRQVRFAIIAVILSLAAVVVAEPVRVEPISFNRDIRPIMSDTCWHCHGPGHQEAGLRLDIRERATRESESGIIPIVPGDSESSEAIRRIFSNEGWESMPPPDSHKTLTSRQKELLRRWVDEGAKYEQHWSYTPLLRPGPPANVHPIDAFIEKTLAAKGLQFAPEASPNTLLRRVTLDLTGLPPTPEEVSRYLSGKISYEAVVDHLLSSPQFAERMAASWLDAVRFADTRGFHSDDEYPIWPYRDYVLEAFHENMPFDQFSREQLAGDLLPDPTQRQKLSSAFNRLNRTSIEGGIQEKEYLAKYDADRVRTVGMVWLGQTIGCAECHDHKYDPIAQQDFYALKAFFADLKYPGATGGVLRLSSPEQEQELTQLKSQQDDAKTKLERAILELSSEREQWEKEAVRHAIEGKAFWKVQKPIAVHADNKVQLHVFNDEIIQSEFSYQGSTYVRTWSGNGIIEASGANPDNAVYEIKLQPGAGTWHQLGVEVFYNDALPGSSFARGNETLYLSTVKVEVVGQSQDKPRLVRLQSAIDDLKGVRSPQFSPLAVLDDDASTAWAVPQNLRDRGSVFLAIRFLTPLMTNAETILKVQLRHETQQRQATIGRFRIALANDARCEPAPAPIERLVGSKVPDMEAGEPPLWKMPGVSDRLIEALSVVPDKRDEKQQSLADDWLEWCHPQLQSHAHQLEESLFAVERVEALVPTCLVSEPTQSPTVTRLLNRGDWMDDTGAVVEPAIPQYLGTLSTKHRATRLDLANWLFSDENPLTARVITNRLWAQFFGVGLCKTLDDFGSQGGWPSHPDLLDWLACEFRDPSWEVEGRHRWNLKHIVRHIVTSRAYKQASLPNAAAAAVDPDNRLLSRQNRYRLDAGQIRDQALSVSGLLRERFGGPSVRPYQVENYLSALYYPRRDYPTSQGDDLWRRSIYTFWQRTFPHPTLMVFDACTREESQVNRSASNTPLQALVLLNDPIFMEAARALAQSVASANKDEKAKIVEIFFKVLSRKPSDTEYHQLAELYQAAQNEFRSSGSASQLLQIGEAALDKSADVVDLAALTVTSRAILNLHESITRN